MVLLGKSMFKYSLLCTALASALFLNACSENNQTTKLPENKTTQALSVEPHNAESTHVSSKNVKNNFVWQADRFADIRVLRYQVPGFEELPLNTKTLLYYLSKAGLSGLDMSWDQNYKHNLLIRKTLETILINYQGDRNTPDFIKFNEYVKRVWFANGIHHHYMSGKFMPEFSKTAFISYLNDVEKKLSFNPEPTLNAFVDFIVPILFDPTMDAKKVDLSANIDNVTASAVNFYEGVTKQEVEDYYQAKVDSDPKRPVSWGLNSKLIKENGQLIEKVWRIDGMYGKAIEQIVFWLEKAITVAENEQQAEALSALVKYYRTGNLVDFDDYNIKWVKDVNSDVDVINGFIEVYDDPVAYRGAFESVVSVKDIHETKVISAIAEQAQWFEDNSPLFPEHKKSKVKGITGKAISVVSLSGACYPSSPIGINLPNANWIRAEHGSKSVSLANIVNTYDQVKGGSLAEFAWDEKEIARSKSFGSLASRLHTDLHEVVGHASGKINPGVGTPKETLKQYASALEEARADLVALYYLMDNKLIEMGIIPSLEVGKASYDSYIRNGLMQQLRRLKVGETLEEAHMRNRQLIASWVYSKGLKDNVIQKHIKANKTYFVVNNYEKLRVLFGDLLREIQRIKSEGDFLAGQALIEDYGVKVDKDLHKEVLARYETLNLAPFSGFINPELKAVMEGDEIVDITISYPNDFTQQMLQYSKDYGFLPLQN